MILWALELPPPGPHYLSEGPGAPPTLMGSERHSSHSRMRIAPAPPRGSGPSRPRAEPRRSGSELPRRPRRAGRASGLARERAAGARPGARAAPHRLPAAARGKRLVRAGRPAHGRAGLHPGRAAGTRSEGGLRQPLLPALVRSPGRVLGGCACGWGCRRSPLRLSPGPLGSERPGTASPCCCRGPGSGTASQPEQLCSADTAGPASQGNPGCGPCPGRLPKAHLLSLCSWVARYGEPEPTRPSDTDPRSACLRTPLSHSRVHVHMRTSAYAPAHTSVGTSTAPRAHTATCTSHEHGCTTRTHANANTLTDAYTYPRARMWPSLALWSCHSCGPLAGDPVLGSRQGPQD